jgi:hypothetical protein
MINDAFDGSTNDFDISILCAPFLKSLIVIIQWINRRRNMLRHPSLNVSLFPGEIRANVQSFCVLHRATIAVKSKVL